LLGGCFLVWLGLAPLSRLSDAVSKVSEKDFQLRVNEKNLPPELRPIAGRLTQTLGLLQRAFDREKQAAADISHELRTPLAAMMTTLDVVLKKPRSAEEYREVLEECRTAGTQMTQLVERMLALARLDAGADHLRAREVEVGKLAEQCAALVRPLAEARGVDLKVEHHGQTGIKADPDKLREVLTNLLHNAIEYNKPNGKIEVEVHRKNGCLQMRVSDTGVGIPPEAREHIFERFYRADSSRHAEGLHAGIGLALVKGYVDLMGGKITVLSEVGVGSTFEIELPVSENGHA
jgi:heavy metal sensor kinase